MRCDKHKNFPSVCLSGVIYDNCFKSDIKAGTSMTIHTSDRLGGQLCDLQSGFEQPGVRNTGFVQLCLKLLYCQFYGNLLCCFLFTHCSLSQEVNCQMLLILHEETENPISCVVTIPARKTLQKIVQGTFDGSSNFQSNLSYLIIWSSGEVESIRPMI